MTMTGKKKKKKRINNHQSHHDNNNNRHQRRHMVTLWKLLGLCHLRSKRNATARTHHRHKRSWSPIAPFHLRVVIPFREGIFIPIPLLIATAIIIIVIAMPHRFSTGCVNTNSLDEPVKSTCCKKPCGKLSNPVQAVWYGLVVYRVWAKPLWLWKPLPQKDVVVDTIVVVIVATAATTMATSTVPCFFHCRPTTTNTSLSVASLIRHDKTRHPFRHSWKPLPICIP